MDIQLAELLKGKSTIIKNKEFFPTKYYVEPFIEKMSKFTNDFRISVKLPDQMTMNADNADVTYNRVLIQAVMPEKHCVDSHDEVYGFLYGIDVKKPVVKMYKGYLNRACTNLSVFNPSWMNVQELLPGDPININPLKQLMEAHNEFEITLKKLKNETIDEFIAKEITPIAGFTISNSTFYRKLKKQNSSSLKLIRTGLRIISNGLLKSMVILHIEESKP